MATLNKLIKDAVKEKEKEIREKARQQKQEKRLAEKVGFAVIRFCRKNGIDNPMEYALNVLNRSISGENSNG